MALIYEFENNGTTMVRSGNTAVGMCFGYSVVWCTKLQKHGDKHLLSKPTETEAGMLQQKVEMKVNSSTWKKAVPDVVRARGHGCGAQQKVNYSMVATTIASSGGCYIIDIGDHWVAAAYHDSTYAFFDSNEGMTTFSDETKFKAGVLKRLKSYKNDTDLDNGWEDTNNIYKVTL